nr:hypothetical protein [Dyella sp. ASV24]
MDESYIHTIGWPGVALRGEQVSLVFTVRVFLGGLAGILHPGVEVEIQAVDGDVARTRVVVMHVGAFRDIGFELHPVQALDVLVGIGIHEQVHLAVVKTQ